jgi:hypothetical protein
MPDAPGFRKVKIEPALGELTEVRGSMPVPDGMITVILTRKGKNGIEGEISLPENVSGRFKWDGKEIVLHGGKQKVDIGK